MKIKYLIIISFFFLIGCTNIADTKKDTVVNNNQTASILLKGSDEDYKRIQAVFSNETEIDWKTIKPKLAKMDNSTLAKKMTYLLDEDIINQSTRLMVQCCGGCAVAVPLLSLIHI